MGARVAKACAAVGYVGAGTVEFLRDAKSGELYFIEMNTRLQVEHPVTEEVTGLDLVEAQLRIAGGERLWFTQDDLHITGHAIEVRINAEDPAADFRPSPGEVTRFSLPVGPLGAGRVRLDAAVEAGSRISPYYDSMVGKVIAWGPDRAAAIAVMSQALAALDIQGVQTTAPLQRQIVASKTFAAGDLRVGEIPL